MTVAGRRRNRHSQSLGIQCFAKHGKVLPGGKEEIKFDPKMSYM